MIKAIIIDDERLGRDLVSNYLSDFNDIELIGEFADGFQGMKAIISLKPDLVFLDVQMPKLTGFEMLELLDDTPHIIFTTAYNEYALKAFEHNAVDYLLKPYGRDRFAEAVKKACDRILVKESMSNQLSNLQAHNDDSSASITRIVVKNRNNIEVIPISKLKYIESQDDYVMIYSDKGSFLKQKTMKFFEQNLPPKEFCRIHRSYIVRLDEIANLESYEKDSWLIILKTKEKLKVSRSGYKKLKEMLDI